MRGNDGGAGALRSGRVVVPAANDMGMVAGAGRWRPVALTLTLSHKEGGLAGVTSRPIHRVMAGMADVPSGHYSGELASQGS